MSQSDRDERAPILVAYSLSAPGWEPVEFAIAASEVTGAPLTIAAIRPGGPVVTAFAGSVPDGDTSSTLDHLRTELQRRHVHANVDVYEARTAGGGFTAAMKALSPVMTVLASSKDSAVGATVMGTTLERVFHEATCPVAVVPEGYRRPDAGVQTIGAAFTPTPEGRDALAAAATLARAGSAKLRVLAVSRDRDEHGVQETLALVESGIDASVVVRDGDAADALVAASAELGLLVMGSRARGPRRATLLGSVSRKVAERAACPVLIVPRGAGETTDELVSRAKVGT